MAEPSRASSIQSTIEEALQSGRIPGMVVAVASGNEPVEFIAVGTDALGQPLNTDSLFPIASITKLATALTVLRLVDAGVLDLNDQLSEHLPHAVSALYGVTLRTLLCHTSGLPTDVPRDIAPYARGLDWPHLRNACLETQLEVPPETHVRYSNVGYGLLGAVVEHISGQGFADALRTLVLEPLAIEGYLGDEPAHRPAVLADVRGSQRDTDLAPFNSVFWRSLALPWGGLVSNAAGALALVRAFQGTPRDFLRPETRAAAIRNQAGNLNGGFVAPMLWTPCPWGLGAELRGTKTPHWAPASAGSDSFGHSGMSGCVAWASPSANCAWAILGARTADSGWLLRRAPAIGAAILTIYGRS